MSPPITIATRLPGRTVEVRSPPIGSALRLRLLGVANEGHEQKHCSNRNAEDECDEPRRAHRRGLALKQVKPPLDA